MRSATVLETDDARGQSQVKENNEGCCFPTGPTPHSKRWCREGAATETGQFSSKTDPPRPGTDHLAIQPFNNGPSQGLKRDGKKIISYVGKMRVMKRSLVSQGAHHYSLLGR